MPQPLPAEAAGLQSHLRHHVQLRAFPVLSSREQTDTAHPHRGRKGGDAPVPRSPAIRGDLQAQLIHEELHDVVTLSVKLQGSPVILRGPLGTGEGA